MNAFFCTTTLASPHRRAFDAAKTLEEIAGTCWHYERETILNLCPPPPPPAAPGDPPNPPLEEGCDPPGEDDWATLTYPAFETLFMRSDFALDDPDPVGIALAEKARYISHWSPYGRVRVVNADP